MNTICITFLQDRNGEKDVMVAISATYTEAKEVRRIVRHIHHSITTYSIKLHNTQLQ
jgi:hypothetical protein